MNKLLILLFSVLIITILLCLLFYNKEKEFKKEEWLEPYNSNIEYLSKILYNGDKWNEYRLADVYNAYKNLYSIKDKDNILYHVDKFPNSIAAEYMKRNTSLISQNTKLLNNILNGREELTTRFKDYDLILHIRVGDILCEYSDGRDKTYSKIGDFSWWKKVLSYIKKNKIKRVFILSGCHKKSCLEISSKYIENRKKFLQKHNLVVEYRIGKSPDNDILFCKNVKHFITTSGGYGRMLGHVVSLNGGNFPLETEHWLSNFV
jgi:hypothetical protein